MSLEARVQQLVEDRDKKAADQLLQNVARQEEIEELIIDGDEITVITERFEGTHTVFESFGRYKMSGGEYEFSSDGVTVSFTTTTARKDVLNSVADVLTSEIGDSETTVPEPTISSEALTVIEIPAL